MAYTNLKDLLFAKFPPVIVHDLKLIEHTDTVPNLTLTQYTQQTVTEETLLEGQLFPFLDTFKNDTKEIEFERANLRYLFQHDNPVYCLKTGETLIGLFFGILTFDEKGLVMLGSFIKPAFQSYGLSQQAFTLILPYHTYLIWIINRESDDGIIEIEDTLVSHNERLDLYAFPPVQLLYNEPVKKIEYQYKKVDYGVLLSQFNLAKTHRKDNSHDQY